MIRIKTISFANFKAFKKFKIDLQGFNILVGPNNSGKSTIISSLKILSEGIRVFKARKPIIIKDINGNDIYGYELSLEHLTIASENIFCNYDDSIHSVIEYLLTDKSKIIIYFPSQYECFMYYESDNKILKSPKDYNEIVGIEVGYVPILGPVEHKERKFQKEAARLALLSHTASRNFRNIWFHYKEDFNLFREYIQTTWPGMDINPPEETQITGNSSELHMFCPEDRYDREIYWAGFGFQVWCQMLTFIIKNKNSTIFLIDEPDIYLHSDLQRQLLGILKGLGPDIIIATHSTEIITEAEPSDILLINKKRNSAQRLQRFSQIGEIFKVLGSNLNPVLTQIAKTRRVLFVEGEDFTILSKFARILNYNQLANRGDFAVIQAHGFNPQRLKSLKEGIEYTVGEEVISAVVFDRDYRTEEEAENKIKDLKPDNYFVTIHNRKEIENFLLIPHVLDRAIIDKISENNLRGGNSEKKYDDIEKLLIKLSEEFKHKTQAELLKHYRQFKKSQSPNLDDSTIDTEFLRKFDDDWKDLKYRLNVLPGKLFITELNKYLQENSNITVTSTNIMKAMNKKDIPQEMADLLQKMEEFRKSKTS